MKPTNVPRGRGLQVQSITIDHNHAVFSREATKLWDLMLHRSDSCHVTKGKAASETLI